VVLCVETARIQGFEREKEVKNSSKRIKRKVVFLKNSMLFKRRRAYNLLEVLEFEG